MLKGKLHRPDFPGGVKLAGADAGNGVVGEETLDAAMAGNKAAAFSLKPEVPVRKAVFLAVFRQVGGGCRGDVQKERGSGMLGAAVIFGIFQNIAGASGYLKIRAGWNRRAAQLYRRCRRGFQQKSRGRGGGGGRGGAATAKIDSAIWPRARPRRSRAGSIRCTIAAASSSLPRSFRWQQRSA